MGDESKKSGAKDEKDALEEMEQSEGQGAQEAPATQGLKSPPSIDVGEDSGEWTRGGGSDPNPPKKRP